MGKELIKEHCGIHRQEILTMLLPLLPNIPSINGNYLYCPLWNGYGAWGLLEHEPDQPAQELVT
jgi:hypothetical protein